MHGSTVAQAVLRLYLMSPSSGPLNRLETKVFGLCQQVIPRWADPLVEYDLDGHRLLLPLSHQLPIIRHHYPHYSSNVGRIARLVATKYSDLTFVDIGANVGDTAFILRSRAQFPILCIEGNERFVAILSVNASRLGYDVFVEPSFVGDGSGEIRGAWVSSLGTARLSASSAATTTLTARSLATILDSYPRFQASKMLKTDTDGYDCVIIRGALPLLERMKPVLFFEYDPYFIDQNGGGGLACLAALSSIGYTSALCYEANGEYLLSTDLSNSSLLEDLHEYYSGRFSYRYCDICAFHQDDQDLFRTARREELDFFRRARGGHGHPSA